MDTAIRDLNDGSQQKWLLIHGLEQGMCIQHLLEQCGPRARKANDEDRTVFHCGPDALPDGNIRRAASVRSERPKLRVLFGRLPPHALDKCPLPALSSFSP